MNAMVNNISPLSVTHFKSVMTLCLGTKSDQGKTPQNLEENILGARHFHERENVMQVVLQCYW